MHVSTTTWIVTVAVISGLLAFDFFFHVRTPHVPTLREAAVWSAGYIGVAVAFGVWVLLAMGATAGEEYFAGYLTEKALSVDGMFVFLVIMGAFAVPRRYQQKVLLFGIAFALVARSALIFVGAALIANFAWVFYVFGLLLLVTAGHLLRSEDTESRDGENVIVRLVRKILPTSDSYDGDRLFTVQDGRRMATPMLLVMIAIGASDVMFALDSVPAIYGITQNAYLVFTATAFSLLGLRQLYFLIDGLLDRLIYLSYGLAAILGLIGTKLILHALHENSVPFINDGQPVPVVEISVQVTLVAIVAILALTTAASLLSPTGRAHAAAATVRRLARDYLEPDEGGETTDRDALFRGVVEAHEAFMRLPMTLRARSGGAELGELLRTVRTAHRHEMP